MRIQSKYLLWVNGLLLLIWTFYIVTDRTWDRRDLLRLEARNLQCMARVLRDAGFEQGSAVDSLQRLVQVMAQARPGAEVMVLDRDSVVRASSVPRRVGRRWREHDIDQVLRKGEPAAWQHKGHFHGPLAMLDVTLPVNDASGRPTHAIHIARRMDLVNELLTEHRTRNLLWAVASLVLIGLLLNLVTYRWLIRPVNRMTDTMARSRWYQPRSAAGDELQRLAASIRHLIRDAEQAMADKDELLDQVRSFNDKLEQEIQNVRDELTATQAELVRRERLAAVGALAAALAHELRNPLHIIRGDAELLSRKEANSETCADILEEVDRINRFVNELLDYTRPMQPLPGRSSVAQVLTSAAEAVRRTHPADGIELVVECAPELELDVDPDHLRQVVVNLASNSVQAMPDGGALTIRAHKQDGAVRLEVQDTGEGIDPADRERLFEPFFTRRPAGTGLGLAVVKRVVDLYHGSLTVESEPGQGTRIVVSFANGGGAG